MAIIRSNCKTNYTVIDNRVFADHRLSFAAMGLLGYLLSKPDNWTISTAQLVTVTEGTGKHTRRDGIAKLLNELKEKGFVQMKHKRTGGVDYVVFDHPKNGKIPQSENPTVGKDSSGEESTTYGFSHSGNFPQSENPALNKYGNKELTNTENTPNGVLSAREDLPADLQNDSDGLQAETVPPARSKKPDRHREDLAALENMGVETQLAKDWLQTRKEKRAGSLTQTVMAGLQREAAKAGLTVPQAVQVAAERGWARFNASYLHNESQPFANPQRVPQTRVNTVPKHENGGFQEWN